MTFFADLPLPVQFFLAFAFRDACNAADVPGSAHGVRKIAGD